jgi:predicted nucleic acid-binding Zn ribbon protein
MKSLGELLGRTLRDTGSASALSPVWSRAVGELIGRHTRPVRWEERTLVIACDALTRKLNEAMGESAVRAIVLELK